MQHWRKICSIGEQYAAFAKHVQHWHKKFVFTSGRDRRLVRTHLVLRRIPFSFPQISDDLLWRHCDSVTENQLHSLVLKPSFGDPNWDTMGATAVNQDLMNILLTVLFRPNDRAKGGRIKGGRTKGGRTKGGRTIISYKIPCRHTSDASEWKRVFAWTRWIQTVKTRSKWSFWWEHEGQRIKIRSFCP